MGLLPRLIVHIGAGKTGSSAIQSFLGSNARQLKRHGFVVPGDDLSSRAGSGQQTAFFQRLVPLDDRGIEIVRKRLTDLRSTLDGGASTVILSAENLANIGDAKTDFAHVFEPVRRQFDVVVVLYIRRQDELFVASWGQWYMKLMPDFRAWLRTHAGKLAVWDNVLRPWETALPDATFIVRVYDQTRLVGGDVVLDFMDAAGLHAEDYGYRSGDRVNQSLNEIGIRVAQRNRTLFKGAHDHEFIDLLKRFGGAPAFEQVNTGLYLTADERRDLLAVYADSNETIRQRFQPTLPPGGLFPPVAEDAPLIDADRQREMEMDMLWNVVFQMHRQWPRHVSRAMWHEISTKARRAVRR